MPLAQGDRVVRRRRLWLVAGTLLLLGVAGWVAWSVAYPVPEIGVGMTEPEVEARLGRPDVRTQDVGHSGVGVCPAAPRWLLGRHDLYVVSYDADGRVAGFDLFENDYRGSRWTHHGGGSLRAGPGKR